MENANGVQCAAESLLLDNRASKHSLPLCEYIRQSGVPVLQSFVTHCGTHSLMRLIIADGSTVERSGLFYTLSTLHSAAAVLQHACRRRGKPPSPPPPPQGDGS